MATVINDAKLKEMAKTGEELKVLVEEFLIENTIASSKKMNSASKRARSLAGDIAKLMKGYRRISLDAFDKDPETKAKLKKKRDERKAAKAAGTTKASETKAKAKSKKKK